MRLPLVMSCLLAVMPPVFAQAPPVDDVLALQVMLDRAGFSPGEIDGRTGTNLRRAIAAFQKAHDLEQPGAPTRPPAAGWLSERGTNHRWSATRSPRQTWLGRLPRRFRPTS